MNDCPSSVVFRALFIYLRRLFLTNNEQLTTNDEQAFFFRPFRISQRLTEQNIFAFRRDSRKFFEVLPQ